VYELRGLKEQLEGRTLWSDRDLISATESDVSGNGRVT
jgi:hypothetical protein